MKNGILAVRYSDEQRKKTHTSKFKKSMVKKIWQGMERGKERGNSELKGVGDICLKWR